MKYLEFKNCIRAFPVFFTDQLSLFTQDIQNMRNQISHWKKSGLLVPLRKGMFLLNENERKLNPSLPFLANSIYAPSYISLEFAMHFYGLIPERVSDITSVTPLKTKTFANSSGVFIYRKIKPECFRGFTAFKDPLSYSYLMALPEKAIIDFLYLNLAGFNVQRMNIFEESYRFQNTEQLKTKALKEYAALFGSKKLIRITDMFIQTLKIKKR